MEPALTTPQEPSAEVGSREVGFRRLVADFGLFSLGGLAGKFIGLLLLPILTRMLSPAELGWFDVLSTLASVLISGFLLGLDVSTLRLYFDAPDESGRRHEIGSWLLVLTLVTVLVTSSVVAARQLISDVLFGTPNLSNAVALAAAAYAGGTFHYFALTICRMRHRVGTFTWLTVGNLTLYGVLTIVLLSVWERTATAAIAGLAVSWAVFGLVGMIVAVRFGIARPQRSALGRIMRVGLPLAPGVLALWGAEFAHRAILVTSSSPTQVAYFSVAHRFASTGLLVAVALQFAWHPEAFRRSHFAGIESILARESRQILVALIAFATAMGLVAPEAVRLVAGSAYVPAFAAVGWAIVYGLGFGVFQVVSLPNVMNRRLGEIGIATGVGAGVGVCGTLLLASQFGAAGAMASIAVATAISCILVRVIGRGDVAIPTPGIAVWLIGGLGVVSILTATLPTSGVPPVMRIALGVIMVLAVVREGSLSQLLVRWQRTRR